MKITRVEQGGVAEELGLQDNDDIISINGEKIRDTIDFQFWQHEDDIELEIKRGDEYFILDIEGGLAGWFGAEFEPFEYKHCGNDCVFCFVDQNPVGLRQPLYFKDEDYRLSFLYGNYVTLTTLSQKQLDRIVEQHLSPLYISVHAVNYDVRKKLLGIKGNDRLLEKIAFLAKHDIEMHTQIVLCPGINDGSVLDQTIKELSRFYPKIKTVAIVPLGLTKHRQNLSKLEPVTVDYSKNLLAWQANWEKKYLDELGSYFFYLADEFYLAAGEPIPSAERYEEFSQIENGVGMVREMVDIFDAEKNDLPKSIDLVEITIATGLSAAPILNEYILPTLHQINGLKVNLVPIRNDFYGDSVTVSGLLVGQDFAKQLGDKSLGDIVFVPPNCLNVDGLFLDDWTLDRVEQELGVPVRQAASGFVELLEQVKEL